MKDILKCIRNTDEALRDLYSAIIDELTNPDTEYTIDFKGQFFDLSNPFTPEEKDVRKKESHRVAHMFLSDAFSKFLADIPAYDARPETERCASMRKTWFNISIIPRATPRKYATSEITSAAAYEVDEGTSKPLDLESIYLQAQRKDLSDEEKWSILLANIEVRDEEKDRKDVE